MDEVVEMFKKLTEAPGVSGYEGEVRNVIREYLEGITAIETDKIGSIVCRKDGACEHPKIMLAGHMDEIGFMVKYITDEGFIKFSTLGGWWSHVLLAQRVVIKSCKGDVVGVIGSKPPHILTSEERNKMVKIKDMYVDVGATKADEVKEMGIQTGDPIIPISPFTVMNNDKMLMGKAFDDRVGCAMFIRAIQELQKEEHPNTVYGVGTVQEEVGLRGAKTSSWLVEPDVGFALEVGIAGDVPGVEKEESQEKLGGGPVILFRDSSMIPHLKLRDFVVDTAKEMEMPIQFDLLDGGTDAGAIHLHKFGVPSIVLSVPTRHIHSHIGILHRDDFDNAVKLLVEVIKRLDAETVAELTEE